MNLKFYLQQSRAKAMRVDVACNTRRKPKKEVSIESVNQWLDRVGATIFLIIMTLFVIAALVRLSYQY